MIISAPTFAADPDPTFDDAQKGTTPLGPLRTFLEQYVGECSDPSAGKACEERAAEFRKQTKGKRFYMRVDGEAATMLSPGRFDASSGSHTVQVTPFFSAGGLALTHGAPKKTDAQGNPVMPLLYAEGTTPPDWSESRFQRLFSSRELSVDVIFTPQALWALPKRGGGKIQGVKAKVEVIRVTTARGGEAVGAWYGR